VSDRLTRQQLKEDPLMKSTGETVDFIQHHMKLIVAGIAGILIIIIAILIFKNSAAQGADQAAGILADARGDMARGALEPAAARLTTVIEDHGKTTAAREATLLYAHLRYGQERYADAETSYRKALDTYEKDPILGPVARRGLAATLENLTRYEEAATLYETLVAETLPGETQVEYRLALARNYLKSGRTDDAIAIYEVLAVDIYHPLASQAAKQRLAEIKPVGTISG
jgi:predicted negative regulator of RcsB-dependent stress response